MFRARSFLFFRVCIFIAFWCRVHQCTLGRFSSSSIIQIIQIIQIGREGGRVCLFSQVLLIRFLFNGIGGRDERDILACLTIRSKMQRTECGRYSGCRPYCIEGLVHCQCIHRVYFIMYVHCSIYKTCYSLSFAFSTVLFRNCASDCKDLAFSSSPVIIALLTSVFNRCSKSFCSASI